MSLIIPANSAAASGGYQVDNSLRFNPASNDRLTRTPSTTGNRNKWTWSGWAKRGTHNQDLFLFGCDEDANNETHLKFGLGGDIRFLDKVGGSTNGKINTLAKFRDLSAWYHIVAVFDKDNSTATDRMIVYVNGVRISVFDGSVMPGNSSILNKAELVEIGALDGSGDMNGYICEVCFIDGQALDATSFGEFDEDSGIWKPINVSGLTFGDQGYFLEFKQSGTSQNSSGLGADTSGNDNHFAVSNLTAIDQSTDTCTTNFATLNALNKGTSVSLSEGNLAYTAPSGSFASVLSTIGVSQGKWYAEYQWKSGSNSHVGIGTQNINYNNYLSESANGYSYFRDGRKFNNNSGATYGNSYAVDDIIGVALDLDNGAIWFSKNGTWQNSATLTEIQNGTTTNAAFTSLSGEFFFGTGMGNSNELAYFNFGSPPYSESGGETDGNGYGNFNQAVPSGYYSLNTKNLSEFG